ncbi:MAG: Uma2 family endonuclease [Desulfamplus sp.]|nr:Uma2 family endonuclease [Desulfamplus sp.]
MNILPKKKTRITPDEYLEIDSNSDIRHEYFNGDIFAMTGSSLRHNIINTNISRELGNRLIAKNSNCNVLSNDMRVKVQEIEKYTYPDIAVVCGEIELEDGKFDTLMNPVIIIEILSDSTEAYDRGKKFFHYRLIPSLQEYILVSQYFCLVERFIRKDDATWNLSSYDRMEQTLRIESIGCDVPLSDIYRWIEFEGN